MEHRYLIGEGDLAVVQEGELTPFAPMKKPDSNQKLSGQPGSPQQLDPRAPRPLPLPERKRPQKPPDKRPNR